MQLNNALIPTMALPQQVEIVPVSSYQTQYNTYDPNDIVAMRKAMQERNKKSPWEALSNALGSVEPKSYTGAYGVEVSNPWVSGIASALQGFDKAYTARKDAERQLADDEFELAKMMAEANKKAITEQVSEQAVKRNVSGLEDPKAGVKASVLALIDQAKELYPQFNKDYPTAESYKNLSGLEAKAMPLYHNVFTASPEEYAAIKKFDTMKKQSVVELRQQMKNQGAITEGETQLLTMMEKANNPYEFELAGQQLVDMWNRRRAIELGLPVETIAPQVAQPVQQQQEITQNKVRKSIDDIWNAIPE